MSQSDSDHITSISADDSSINFSDNFYVPRGNDIPPCDNCISPSHPDAEIIAAWQECEKLAEKERCAAEYSEESSQLIDKIVDICYEIEKAEAKTIEGISIQLKSYLSCYRCADEFSPSEDILKLLRRIEHLASTGQLQMRPAGSNAGSDDDGDLWGNLDLAMVNMLAGLGVLGGLVDRYHATGKDIDSEAVTWLASKLNDDLDQISDSIDPLRPAIAGGGARA